MVEPGASTEDGSSAPQPEGLPIAPDNGATPSPAGRLFLSYASQDVAVAQKVCSALEASGQSCWLAPRDVHAGEYYATAIIEAINSCRMLVLLLSRSAIESPHVLREVERACSKRHPVLTVRLDDAAIPAQLEYFLSANQWLDASGGRIDAILAALIAAGRGQTSVPQGAVSDAGRSRPGSTASSGRNRIVIAIAAVVAIAAACFLALRFWPANATGPAPPAGPVAAAVAAPPAAPRTAVAVLPFANLTGDASKEYLGDGMAEELINTLNKVSGLKVPARTSSFAYKNRNADIRQIAKDLGVGTILEGSVRAAGKRIRIAAQLINAQDGLPLWSESYDEEFTDIFKLQDKLATQIATALQPSLGAVAQAAVAQGPPTRDVEAYNLYLQGWALVARPNEANLRQATTLFEQAIDRDPKFARAYAGIAEAQATWFRQGWQSDKAIAALRFARQALALDPQLASAHNALAVTSSYRGRYLEMEIHGRAALAIDPRDGWVHTIRANSLLNTGHIREALAESQEAYALAPANPLVIANLAFFHMQVGHDAESLKFAESAVSKGFPKASSPLHLVYGTVALRAGRYAEAAGYLAGPSNGLNYEASAAGEMTRLVMAAVADPGKRDAALAARGRLFPNVAAGTVDQDEDANSRCLGASMRYALLAAIDVTYELANRCMDQLQDGQTVRLATLWLPELRAGRRDPRFQALATRLGLMDYWQQYGPPDDCDLANGKLTCH